MSPEGQLICYFLAFVLLVVAAVYCFVPIGRSIALGLVASGLACFVFVYLWTAMKAV